MTGKSDQIRAVVLAALMVTSVFAGVVAFTGSAAALSNGTVNVGTTQTDTNTTYVVSATTDGVATTSQVNSIEIQLGGTNLDNANLTADNVTVGDAQVADVSTSGSNVTIDVTDDSTSVGITDFRLDALLSTPSAPGNYNVTATVSTANGDESALVGSYPVGLTDNNSLLFSGQSVVYDTSGDGVSNYVLREGSPGDDEGPVRTLPDSGIITIDTASLDTGSYYIRAGNGDAVLSFEIIEQDFSAQFDDNTVGDDGQDANTTLEFSSDNRAEEFDVNVTVEDSNLDDSELLNIFGSDASVGNTSTEGYNVSNVDLDEDQDQDGIRLYDVSDGEEIETTFDGVDTGEYNFTFSVTDADVEDSASIEVTETQAGTLAFNDSTLTEQQGDVASVNVSFNNDATEGTLLIGKAQESGYQANVTLEDGNDDGTVEVLFNTYAAGDQNNAGAVVQAGDSDDQVQLADQTNLSSILESTQNGYQLAVGPATGSNRFNETLESPDELGTLFLEESSEGNMSTWTAPDGIIGDVGNLGDVQSAIENGELTETETVAYGDVAVFRVQAGGLEGALQGQSLSDLLNETDNGVYFQVEEAGDSPNRESRTVALTGSSVDETELLVTEDNQHFIMVDTGDNGLTWNNSDEEVSSGTPLEANLTVTDNRLLDDNDDETSYTTQFEHQEPDASFDEDPLEVPATQNATISGTTNIAPGSELTVRVQSTDSEARFIKTNESVVVTPNGTWNAAFDFTDDAAVGDEFEATIRNYGGDQVSVTGTVVEGNATNETDTPDGNETDVTTTDETPTDGTPTDGEPTDETPTDGEPTDGEPTDETPTDGTETGTPGFTAVLALVALIGAALIAIRRD